MSNEPDQPTRTLEAKAITNFQLMPDNGGFNLVLGTRTLVVTGNPFDSFPEFASQVLCVGFLPHPMLKDLARVIGIAIHDFERKFGTIPLPGVDDRPDQDAGGVDDTMIKDGP